MDTDFKYSAFISYAWADNNSPVTTNAGGATDRGWVEKFRDLLAKCLTLKLGPTRVFRDEYGLRHDSSISNQLDERLSESATLVIIASPSYLQSKWCGDELKMFREHCRARGQMGGIFVCALDIIHEEGLPQELQGLLRFKLYKSLDNESERAGTMRLEFEYDSDERLIHETCAQLAEQIKSIALTCNRRPAGVGGDNSSQLNVFLADATDDLVHRRQELRHQITDLGHRVLPDADKYFDYSSDDYEQKLESCLEDSDVFVQVLGGSSGRIVRDINATYSEYQYQKASELGLPIHQWRSKDISIEDELPSVLTETYKKMLFGEHVVAMNFEMFKSFLQRSLVKNKREVESPNQLGVVIRYDERERSEVAELQKSLISKGLRTQLFNFSETIGELIQESCALLTYCKDVTPNVRKAIWDMQKLCFGSGKPVFPCLYMVPPPANRIPPGGFDGMYATTSLDDFVTALKKQKPR